MTRRAVEPPPIELSSNLPQWLRSIARVLQGVLLGKTNNVRDVTLAVAPATETVLADVVITKNTAAVLSPRSASAAAAMTVLWHEVTAVGELTIHHDADAAEDRTFAVVLHG